MSYNAKNYAAQGGDEWVIGGKLTVLPEAEVSGLSGGSGGSGGSSYTLPTASADTLGGVKAKAKGDEAVEVAVDESGKLYVPKHPVAEKVDDAADTEGESLKTALNALLASLRKAGLLAES